MRKQYKKRKLNTEEVKQEIRREIKKLTSQEIMALIQENHTSLLPSEKNVINEMLKYNNSGVDVDYIRTVLFPEQFSYDIPLPLSSISYSRFTDKQEIHITPGSDGSGMLVFYPRTNGGPCLFYLPGGQPFYNSTSTPDITPLPGAGEGVDLSQVVQYSVVSGSTSNYFTRAWQWGCPTYSWQHFNQTALISASISIQYIGRVELEAGEIVGGHLHGVGLNQINTDEIENAQWSYSGRPGDGFRAIYLPKDSNDFEFYPTTPGTAYNQGGSPQPLMIPSQTVQLSDQINTYQQTTSTPSQITMCPINISGTGTGSNPNSAPIPLIGYNGKSTPKVIQNTQEPWISLPSTYDQIAYVKNTSCIAIYFTGLQVSSTPQFRIDINRRFLGIPKSEVRDIVDMVRPRGGTDIQKTFNTLNSIAASAPIGSHSLKNIDMAIDPLMRNIGNIAYMADNGIQFPLYKSIHSFAEGIADPRNLEGQRGEIPQRLYKYYF